MQKPKSVRDLVRSKKQADGCFSGTSVVRGTEDSRGRVLLGDQSVCVPGLGILSLSVESPGGRGSLGR